MAIGRLVTNVSCVLQLCKEAAHADKECITLNRNWLHQMRYIDFVSKICYQSKNEQTLFHMVCCWWIFSATSFIGGRTWSIIHCYGKKWRLTGWQIWHKNKMLSLNFVTRISPLITASARADLSNYSESLCRLATYYFTFAEIIHLPGIIS